MPMTLQVKIELYGDMQWTGWHWVVQRT